MNTASPTKTVELRQVTGGSPLPLEPCTRTSCAVHPDGNGVVQSHCPFGVIGLSYRTASLVLRGRAGFDEQGARGFLDLLRRHEINEAMVLSTCNRTEVYFAGQDDEQVVRLLASAIKADIDEIRPHLYLKKGLCAACHLFRVVSGLDSAVLGETEIVSQVKQSWKIAEQFGSCGPGLSLLLQRAMEVGKRVRTETELCKGITSTATLAVLQAQAKLGSLEGRKVALVGSGQIAERVCKELTHASLGSLTILNRTVEKAELLSTLYGASARPLGELEEAISEADVVITAVTSNVPLIDDALLARVNLRRESPLLLIDLGVPANIDVAAPVPGVEVVDLDSLSAACSQNLDRRAQSVPVALDLLDGELDRLRSELTMRTASPTIKALVNQAELIRRQNFDWAMERLTGLT
ncbi:MAG TPA: glutamyl-tRNA reductase, partial [Fimbriimonadaceae bacterium]|nr:glutamyl-tRNA reductase [Fimbriimonadaceae bacterium]